VFEFIKETFYGIALLVKLMAEDRRFDTIGHGADISPGSTFIEPFTKGVGVICPIRQKDIPRQHGVEHILGASPVVGPTFGQFQEDRQPHSIDESVDFGRQTALRATHATGSGLFFYRSQHVDEHGWMRTQSSGCPRHKPLIRLLKDNPTRPPCAIG